MRQALSKSFLSALLISMASAAFAQNGAAPADPATASPPSAPSSGESAKNAADSVITKTESAPAGATNIFAGFMDPFDYDPRGRRDPFSLPIDDKPMAQGQLHLPLLPLQRYELNQFRLMGIMWDVRSPKAMLKDPSGQIHIIGPNAKIGPRNGYVAVIREGEIVVVETMEQEGRLISTAQVVKIAK